MEVSGRRVRGSEEHVNACDNCVTLRSISRTAFGYCIDCRDFKILCEDCYHGHRYHKPLRHHMLLQGNQMPKERLKPVDMCQVHADEMVTYFCNEHNALACQKCAFLKHRLCKDVSDIATVSSDPKQNERYKDLTKRITTLESKTDKTRQIRLQNRSKIDTNQKKAKADIKVFCKTMHDHLNKIETTAEVEVNAISDEDKSKMDNILQQCDSVSAELKVVTTDLETNQEPNRKNELFIAIERAMVVMATLDDRLTTLSNDNTVRGFMFEPDERLQSVIADVETLGRLSVRSMDNVFSTQSAKVKVKVKPPLNLDTIAIEIEDDINVSTQSDKYPCCISGSTMVESDTTLAIADKLNQSVKLVDVRQKRVVSQIHLSGGPNDVTRVQLGQLAVTLPNQEKIQFLFVNRTSMSLGREMKVAGRCCGIDYSNDQLFISFSDTECRSIPKVQILSMSGSVLKTISAQTDKHIEFILPYYLTLSIDRYMLYVSDGHGSTFDTDIEDGVKVYCLDLDGGVKATYKDQGFVCPFGISAAEDGSLFVCGARNLLVISSDCRQSRVLLDESHGLQEPHSVLYNSALSTLYVGQYGSGTLKVFKLKFK